MEQLMDAYISEHKLCTRNDHILVAVSGGVDSMVLMHLFHQLGYQVAIGHCNFKMRGEISDEEVEFVRKKANLYSFPFHTIAFNTHHYAEENRIGIQEAARHLRYRWFSEIMIENDYNLLAVAHHQDDQIETVFLNMIRGTGLSGLQGMQPKRDHIIRPLLFASKADIRSYALRNHLEVREDSSNAKSIYRRNYIRNKWIPQIEKRVPSFKARMSENILIWQKSTRLLSGLLNQELELRKKTEGNYIILDSDKIEDSLRDLVIFEWLRPYGFNYTQVTQMIEAIERNHSGRIFYSVNNRVTTDRKKLVLSTKSPDEMDFIIIHQDDKIINLENGRLEFILMTNHPDFFPDDQHMAHIDAQKIDFPLTVRRWTDGDSFQPLGMNGQSQKLKKYFRNRKFNTFQKENQWLLLSDDKICWVIGERLDERFRIDEHTKYVLRIHWQPF
ncbi:MAG: tRNA lysidine(34) synthetase TilS [Saprospiraceae bacterium]|nr:tRNA lysidine(34) synthetase TilS [Saprospiraceae bacterium]